MGDVVVMGHGDDEGVAGAGDEELGMGGEGRNLGFFDLAGQLDRIGIADGAEGCAVDDAGVEVLAVEGAHVAQADDADA